jgi:hypothetical protein
MNIRSKKESFNLTLPFRTGINTIVPVLFACGLYPKEEKYKTKQFFG